VHVCTCVCLFVHVWSVCAVFYFFLDLPIINAQITATSYKNLDKVPKTYTLIQLSTYKVPITTWQLHTYILATYIQSQEHHLRQYWWSIIFALYFHKVTESWARSWCLANLRGKPFLTVVLSVIDPRIDKAKGSLRRSRRYDGRLSGTSAKQIKLSRTTKKEIRVIYVIRMRLVS